MAFPYPRGLLPFFPSPLPSYQHGPSLSRTPAACPLPVRPHPMAPPSPFTSTPPQLPVPDYKALPHEAGCGEEGALVCAGGHIAGRQGVALDDLVYIMTRWGRGRGGCISWACVLARGCAWQGVVLDDLVYFMTRWGAMRTSSAAGISARKHWHASDSSRFRSDCNSSNERYYPHGVPRSPLLPFPRIARQTESDGIDKVFAAADSAAQLMEAASPLLQQATELVEQLTPLMAELRGGGLVGGAGVRGRVATELVAGRAAERRPVRDAQGGHETYLQRRQDPHARVDA